MLNRAVAAAPSRYRPGVLAGRLLGPVRSRTVAIVIDHELLRPPPMPGSANPATTISKEASDQTDARGEYD